MGDNIVEGEWKAVEGSKYFESPKLYKENGFKKEEDAKILIDELKENDPLKCQIVAMEKKKN